MIQRTGAQPLRLRAVRDRPMKLEPIDPDTVFKSYLAEKTRLVLDDWVREKPGPDDLPEA